MAQDSTKIIATRDMIPYYTAYRTTNALPADTVLWSTAWGTPAGQGGAWINAGYTNGGLHFATEVARTDIRVDQELDPVLRPATSRTASMNCNLSQFTPALIAVATGQGSVETVAATTAARGHDDFVLSSTVVDAFYAIGFDIRAQDQEAIRFVGWRGQTTGSPTFDVTPEAALLTPLNLTLFPDTSTSPARIATIRDILPVAA
jgi:hypothetical protein